MSLFKRKKDEPAKVIYDEPTPNQVASIKAGSWEMCYLWWGKLNTCDWPEELSPEDRSDIGVKEYTGNSVRSQLMRIIERKVGMKFILRQWNVYVKPEWEGEGFLGQKRMTETEFEDWWPNSYSFKP